MVRDKQFYRALLALALPVALQSMVSLGVNLLDNVMVGSLGETSISAVALSNQVTTFFNCLVKGICGGTAVLLSQYWGKRDMTRIRTIFGMIFRLMTVAALLCTALLQIFPAQVMRCFTDDAEILPQSILYLRIVSFSFLCYAISESLLAMLRCVQVVKIALVISFVTLFTNLFFNYMLIYGHWFFPKLEMRGAAYATLISRIIEMAVTVVYVFCREKTVQIKLRDLFRRGGKLWKDFLRYGVPIVIGDVQWGFVGVCKAGIIGHLGAVMVTANSITETVLSLGAVFTTGLSSAACVLIGKSVGEEDRQKTRAYSNTIQLLFLLVGVGMMSLLFVLRRIPVSFYNIQAETAQVAVDMLALGAITMLGTTYHASCFTGINRGAGDARFVFWVDLFCGWLVVLPMTFLAGHVWKLSFPLVFLCSRSDQCFKWMIAFFRLRGNKWIHDVTRTNQTKN